MNSNDILPCKILIIDDDEDDFFITSEYIKHIPGYNFIIEWCYKYEEALKHIRNNEYDLYMVDYYLGAKTGLDFIKDSAKHSDYPIILLTGKGNHKIDIEAMQAGAIDYLIKGELDTEKLERSIRHSLQRSKAMRALSANEIKYRHIFENSLNAIFLTNEQLEFLDVNPATVALLEYTREELINSSLYSFLSSTFDKTIFQEVLTDNEDIKEEVELITKSGEVRYCLLSFSKEIDSSGKPYLQGIANDISNLKKEEKQKIYREKLDIAERISRTLAHEIRNPLNNIDLAAEQIALGMPNINTFTEIIRRNSKRIGALITELLSGTPNIVLTENSLNLQQIVEESLTLAKDRIVLKKIKLDTNYANEIITIKADSNKLKIAFLNIIINAIEAMQPDKGELTVVLKKENSKAIVSIQDNGCGIAEENIPLLFEAYFTDKKNGLGLGLSTTNNIIKLHNGELSVFSKLNEGTNFVIGLPVA
ncbi:MAG TPA: ATP-binding protein [Ferruginibacter sp.]|nr:ATP-binding protein [Ferruginibacter sp.]